MAGAERSDRPIKQHWRRAFWSAVLVLGLGAVLYMILPHGAFCHVLGGALEVVDGPGKPTRCVIPWDDR